MVPRPSNTAIGTAFELATLSFLTKPPLSLSLIRVGGKNDRGVDLRGWWEIPQISSSRVSSSTAQTISSIKQKAEVEEIRRRKRWSVIVQCKAESKAVGPVVVRELEGTVGNEDLEKNTISGRGRVEIEGELKRIKHQTVGILVSQGGFSKEALLRAAASTLPLSLIELDFRSSNILTEPISNRNENNKPISSTITFNPALRSLLGLDEIVVPTTRTRSFSERHDSLKSEWFNGLETNVGRNPLVVG